MPVARSSVLVVSDAGGNGKTLVSRLLVAARPGCRPVGFDRRDGSSSKFARLLAVDGIGVLDLVSDNDLRRVGGAGEAMAVFDVIGDAVLEGGAVVDTGAKAASNIALWASAGGGGEYLRSERAPVHIVVPAVATANSLRAARDAVERLGAPGMLDGFRPVLVFNGLHGEFDEIVGNADLSWLQGRVASGRAKCVVMPKCRGGVLPFIEAERLGFAAALSIAPAAFTDRFGVSEDRALWWLRCFVDFVADVLGSFAMAGVGREPVAERQRLAELDVAWAPAAKRIRSEIVGRVQAVPVGIGESEIGILRKISRDDALLLADAFPDTLQLIGQEIAGAAMRGLKPDFDATRRAVETSFRAMEARQGRAGIEPRLGRYRRDIVLEAQSRGIDLESHRVAAVSYVHDLQDLGRRGVFRALRFLARYHVETALLKLRLLRQRSWPPSLY